MSIEGLKKKFGIRMKTVEKWLMEPDRVSNYTVDSDGEISCIVKGESDEYAVTISRNGVVSCGCWGWKRHQKTCKHILFTVIHSWINGNLNTADLNSILEG